MHVCVCLCACARVRVCVCVWAHLFPPVWVCETRTISVKASLLVISLEPNPLLLQMPSLSSSVISELDMNMQMWEQDSAEERVEQ